MEILSGQSSLPVAFGCWGQAIRLHLNPSCALSAGGSVIRCLFFWEGREPVRFGISILSRNRRGFTLAELLVVIAIIGVLAA